MSAVGAEPKVMWVYDINDDAWRIYIKVSASRGGINKYLSGRHMTEYKDLTREAAEKIIKLMWDKE